MSIRPGLERISQLLATFTPSWRAIHVAGTNGKGSICYAIDASLRKMGIRTGRFTTPHLIDRWDCVCINGTPISREKFEAAERHWKAQSLNKGIDVSPFELLTATAFEVLNRERVQVGIVECGMGGEFDATNILRNPLVSVIASVSLDHMGFLGDTVGQIAQHKAGIIKPGRPAVVDAQNPPDVLDVVRAKAEKEHSELVYASDEIETLLRFRLENQYNLLPHELRNIRTAATAVWTVRGELEHLPPSQKVDKAILEVMATSKVPGRRQTIDLSPLTGSPTSALLDGAHNEAAWQSLALLRTAAQKPPATWIVAASAGKDVNRMLSLLVQPEDNLVAVEFGPADGMPWVKCVPAQSIAERRSDMPLVTGQTVACGADLNAAINEAANIAAGNSIFIAGSLYLASDVLRLLRDGGRSS